MINILFISDDTRVPDLIARFQPQLKARMRLALDFDQGLKEVFDNRPSAVFIQGDISGISGETVARHIKTLLRADAPRIVLIHTSPLSVQGTKKWFDDAVDFSLQQTELAEQFRLRLMEIDPNLWLENNDVHDRSAGSACAADTSASLPSSPPGEFESFDWETPGNVSPSVAQPPSQAASAVTGGEERDLSRDVSMVLVGRGVDASGPVIASPESELQCVMPSIIEETATAQSAFSKHVSPPDNTPAAMPPLREAAPIPPPSPLLQPSPPQGVEASGEQPAASMADFIAESPGRRKAEWVTIPSPDQKVGEATGQRLTLWAAAIVVLLIGVVAGGALLLKGGGSKAKTPAKPAVQVPPPARPSSASAPAAKAAPAMGLPSFIPASGKDEGYGKAHPGWERYRGDGIEFRLFREKSRLKAVQVIALRGNAIPETLAAAVVKELTGGGSRAVSSRTKKGGYQREAGKVDGRGDVVIYRKGGHIRGVVVTLG